MKTVSGVLDRIATTVLPRSLSQDKTSPSGYSPNRKDSLSPNKPTEEEVKIIEDSDQILVDIDIPNYEASSLRSISYFSDPAGINFTLPSAAKCLAF